MARVRYFDNVRHAISAIAGGGTGDVTFGSVPNGWRSLTTAGAAAGIKVPYELRDGDNWENGYMLLNASLATGTRSVLKSNNSDAAIVATTAAVFTIVFIADMARDTTYPKSADYAAVDVDRGKTFGLTGSAKTLSFDTAANMGDGWDCWAVNQGSGNWTISATTSFTLYPGEGCRIYCDGTSIIGIKGAGSNRYDQAVALTDAQSAQARANLYAAPFDALAYNGMQVNGSMEVSQENGTTSLTLANGSADKYAADCFGGAYNHAAATAVVTSQNVAPPGSPAFGACFRNVIQLKATTALSSPAAGDYGLVTQRIEGYRVARLGFGNANAQSVSIGFWVYATIAGTMTLGLRNSAHNRTYLVNIAINNATTWEYKTVTITGDTSGTWLYTTGNGLELGFCFCAGSTFQGTNAAWNSGNYFGTSSTTNFFASNNNLVCITGVIVLPGIELPSSTRAPLIMRPFDQELMLCKRQLEYIDMGYSGGATNGTAYGARGVFQVEKRNTTWTPTRITNLYASNFPSSAPVFGFVGQTTRNVWGYKVANATSGDAGWYDTVQIENRL